MPLLFQKLLFTDSEIVIALAEEQASSRGRRGVEQDDEWAERSVRKACAGSVDALAALFEDELLPHVLAMLNETAQSNKPWQVLEAGVLALGAIASGCLHALSPHMQVVMPFLVANTSHQSPFVRGTACWSISRYGPWLLGITDEAGRAQFVSPALLALLGCMADASSPRVCDAACSAFSLLAECVDDGTCPGLAPYVDALLPHLLSCVASYKGATASLPYDVIIAVLDSLDSPQPEQRHEQGSEPPRSPAQVLSQTSVHTLLSQLFAKWNALPDNDMRNLPAVLECLTSVMSHVSVADMAGFAPTVLERCLRLIQADLAALQQAAQDPSRRVPDTDLMECALDLLCALADVLKEAAAQLFAGTPAAVPLLCECLKVQNVSVLLSTFCAIGNVAKYAFAQLQPVVPHIIPAVKEHLNENYQTVCTNASWALGEIALRYGDSMRPFIPMVLPDLARLINLNLSKALAKSVAICIARIALVVVDAVTPFLNGKTIACVCLSLGKTRNLDAGEKDSALRGLCAVISHSPAAVASHLPYVCHAMLICHPSAEQAQLFAQTLRGFAHAAGPQWAPLYDALPPGTKRALLERFGVGP
eukprot:TRINITY_DN4788_c0_g1_i2.p1 TRINITY_DN4788_c0_g1~~TRINITY_DN4788_c0_g1_i2.p1  ORF type:complete len:591 (-),score=117.66 TRINITY_DN4788_c0_g1_i2:29-1801(-)